MNSIFKRISFVIALLSILSPLYGANVGKEPSQDLQSLVGNITYKDIQYTNCKGTLKINSKAADTTLYQANLTCTNQTGQQDNVTIILNLDTAQKYTGTLNILGSSSIRVGKPAMEAINGGSVTLDAHSLKSQSKLPTEKGDVSFAFTF